MDGMDVITGTTVMCVIRTLIPLGKIGHGNEAEGEGKKGKRRGGKKDGEVGRGL